MGPEYQQISAPSCSRAGGIRVLLCYSLAMKYQQSFEVRFCEADQHSRLTPVALFNYLQECAIRHGDAAGMPDGEGLADMGYAWMMNRLHFEVDRYARRQETVHVETWCSTLTGLFAIREWNVTDDSGVSIARATGRWVIFDIRKRRIVKLPEMMAERYGEHEGRGIDDAFDRMTPIESGEHEKRFHVRLSELDSNQHANSASYIDWCLEAVPEDVLKEYLPCDIEITYKKESRLGDGLIASSLEEPSAEPTQRVFRHAILLDEDGALLTMGKSVWRSASGPAEETQGSEATPGDG